ncbi:hypothetical protein WA026_005520 [Henosepilachna vigintioctopunctata]|uniref:Spaetzle domain-containing protein n=1 Tax=Henosepilachna vigintioctopunctata TaxID=420089 RepID=A0AAW1U3G0_9CUCU
MFDSGRITNLFLVVFIQILCTRFLLSEPLTYEQSKPPSTDEREDGDIFVPKITNMTCTDVKNFCEEIDGYPEDYMKTKLRDQIEKYKFMLWEDSLEDENDNILRMDEGEFFCASKSYLKFPKIALNTRNEWKFIYNNDEHKQGIRVVYCLREEAQCIVSPRFQTICRQIFVDRSMLTISHNGTLEIDTFNQPVTCCCSLKYTPYSNVFLILFSKPCTSAYAKKRENAPASVFPDDGKAQSIFVPKITSSSCSELGNFCEDAEGYPDTYVDTKLTEEAEKHKYMFRLHGDAIAARSMEVDDFFCATKTQLKFPKVARNSKNEWKYIFNTHNYKQGILVKYCHREGSACLFSVGLFKTSCKQKYASRIMLTISYNGSLEADSFNQPVTCCCSLKPLIAWNAG